MGSLVVTGSSRGAEKRTVADRLIFAPWNSLNFSDVNVCYEISNQPISVEALHER